MLAETLALISIINEEYGINLTEKIKQNLVHSDNYDVIKLGNSKFIVNKGTDEKHLKELASFIIFASSDDISEVSESVDDTVDEEEEIEIGSTYIYNPLYTTETDEVLNQCKGLKCKVIDKLVLFNDFNDEDENMYEVTFAIEDNADVIDIPEDDTQIVFETELLKDEKDEVEEVQVSEDLSNEIETSTALLTAIQSEKEAVITYEMLINMSTEQDEINLLTKILNDEKEHIALLTGMQSAKTAEYVSEEHKEELDDFAQEIIDSDTAE